MVAITATAPRLTPTTTHRIQPGIYGSFNACQILLLVLLSPARGAVRFSVTSSIVSFRAISAMSLAYPAVLLMYSRDSLTLPGLPGSGTCPFLWQLGRRLRSSGYFLQCHNCLIYELKVAPEQCFDRASQHRQSK
jgi:hypothetical protein